jgi:hypothetical protein
MVSLINLLSSMIIGVYSCCIFLVVQNCHWKITYDLLLEVLLVATSLTMSFKVFNLIQAILMFASSIITYTNVKDQNEPQN